MSTVYRRGKVIIQDRVAGIIKETDEGYEFRYSDNYLTSENPIPVSLTMPLRKEPFISTVLFPFFDGLIPEGWLLEVVHRHWNIESPDRFGVLLVACHDCIGDVQIYEMEEGEQL